MGQIQLIQVTPTELADLISDNVNSKIQELSNDLKSLSQTKEKEILTRKEVADLFGVSLVCIHSWMNSEILKHYKIGNKTFFKRAEVMEILFNSNRIK